MNGLTIGTQIQLAEAEKLLQKIAGMLTVTDDKDLRKISNKIVSKIEEHFKND